MYPFWKDCFWIKKCILYASKRSKLGLCNWIETIPNAKLAWPQRICRASFCARGRNIGPISQYNLGCPPHASCRTLNVAGIAMHVATVNFEPGAGSMRRHKISLRHEISFKLLLSIQLSVEKRWLVQLVSWRCRSQWEVSNDILGTSGGRDIVHNM